ncbi:MAG: AAA family ATPase [Desulfobulbaceae bacterium]|jgi:shikimate kinase|nr:AAA family ATPase [Desulfobulbaceae bacterium]
MNIILTGFMGTGKSAVGRLLAARLGLDFVDTDALIEERQGQSVAAIFAERGEAVFRRMEAALAEELAARDDLVIATGGKFMLATENAKALAAGRIFCLFASPEDILARVMADGAACRPLLAAPEPETKIRALLAERQVGYAQFPAINTSGKTPGQIAAEIAARLAAQPAADSFPFQPV